jgi:DNA modification methylase
MKGTAVFDGYAGSCTTGEACIIEKRRFYGAENDKEEGYYEQACKRLGLRLMKPQLF